MWSVSALTLISTAGMDLGKFKSTNRVKNIFSHNVRNLIVWFLYMNSTELGKITQQVVLVQFMFSAWIGARQKLRPSLDGLLDLSDKIFSSS